MHCRCQNGPLAAIGLMGIVSLTWALAACDSQVSPGYRGESLLTVTGSVEFTENNRTPGPLIPALAFTGQNSEILIVDAEAHGTFPSDFRLDVYDEPPKTALIPTSEIFESDEKMALGFITAVPVHHRDVIRYADTQDGALLCPDGGCSKPLAPFTLSWCTSSGKIECYKETVSCSQDPVWDNDDALPDGCEVTASEGDRSLKEPWREFAGFSQDYVVLYLRVAAKPGSYLAAGFGPAGLEQGYHLLALNPPPSGDKKRELQACLNEASDTAIEHYNAAHDTQYTVDEAQGGTCGVTNACAPFDTACAQSGLPKPGLCSLPEDEQTAIIKQIGLAIQQAETDRGCWQIAPRYTLIPDPQRVSIAVHIGAEPPLFIESGDEDPAGPTQP